MDIPLRSIMHVQVCGSDGVVEPTRGCRRVDGAVSAGKAPGARKEGFGGSERTSVPGLRSLPCDFSCCGEREKVRSLPVVPHSSS